jgi:hypothetical protein
MRACKKDEYLFMKNRLFFFLTPCIIASVGLMVMIIDSLLFLRRSKGDSYTGIIVALPFFAFYLLADYFLRKKFTRALITIWIIEILILILSAVVFWNYFPFKDFTVKH